MLQNLLDALDPPVLIFLPEGTMAFSNPSARKRLAGDLASPARHRSLLKMLHGLAGDRLPSPMRFALPFDCASGATARLDGLDIEGPNPRNAVLIADPYVPASSTLPLRQACEPSDAELRAPAPGESPAADPIEGARAGRAPRYVARARRRVHCRSDRRRRSDRAARTGRRGLARPGARRAHAARERLDRRTRRLAAACCGSRRWFARAIRECVENALRHARVASPGGAPPIEVELAARQAGPFPSLRITHRGVGRLPALGDRAELPFPDPATTRRAAGSREPAMRIGLPLAQGVLQQHGGQRRLGADGHDDTTVIVLEPPTGAPRFADGHRAGAALRGGPPEDDGRRPRPARIRGLDGRSDADDAMSAEILIVEDRPEIQTLIRSTLEFEGHDPHTADEGADGWRLAQTLRPDLVLLDITMPGDLDGLQVCERIRAPAR